MRCMVTGPGDVLRTCGWIFRCLYGSYLMGMSIDWSKCFDRVPQGIAVRLAERQGLHPRGGTYRELRRRFVMAGHVGKELVFNGVIQGCHLSVLLLNLLMNTWARAVKTETTAKPQRSSRRSLRCYLGAVHRLGSGELVDACHGFDASHVVASVSRFSPFGKPQSLPDRARFPHDERWCLSVPTHPLQDAVHRSHQPITHLSTIRIAAPDSLKLREGLWSSLSHAPQLSQTLIGRILQWIDEVTLTNCVSTISRHRLLRFVRQRAGNHCCPQ